jgi:hypothetical protein
MEKAGKTYRFFTFSSAEGVHHLGIDFLVRLGVTTVWIGAESERVAFKKNKDIDLRALIKELQANGISVFASAILFLDHHDKVSIEADVNWALSLEADINQFLQLMPVPGTPLFTRYQKEGRLSEHPPYPKMNGGNELPFTHPHFTAREAMDYVSAVSTRKYREHGPSMVSMILTALQGYEKADREARKREEEGLAWNPEARRYEKNGQGGPDVFMQRRIAEMREFARRIRVFLLAAWVFSPNTAARQKAIRVMKRYDEVFGKASGKERLISIILVFFSGIEWVRHWFSRTFKRRPFARQPPSRRIAYRQ